VRRVIEVHGGRVWVELAGLGHGATFCFTLARACLSRRLQQCVLGEELAQAIARWLTDDRAAIDVAHGLIWSDRGGRLDRAVLLIGDEQRGHGQTADELLQLQRRIGFARDIDFGKGHAEFLQAQARSLLIAAGSFASVHEELSHGRDYT
jgi:hypothetical protein